MANTASLVANPVEEAQEFASLVAEIVAQKMYGTYKNITPEVVGGWFVSRTEQDIQKAEAIADAVVARVA